MTETAQKPRTPQENASTFQRMLDKRHVVYAFIEKATNETIMYTQTNPKKALKIGVAALGIAGYIGYQVGNHSYDNRATSLYRVVVGLDVKMNGFDKKMDTIVADHATLVTGVNDMSRAMNQRIVNIENEKHVTQAVEAGEKHVAEVKKKNSFGHKILRIFTLGIVK